jgi:CRISPR system Cascade subunit CasD
VLGLVAACLGLERTDERAHTDLSDGLGLAIRREGPTSPLLADYHTAQAPPTRRNRVFASRREELGIAKQDLATVLTRRDYRTDIAFSVALWRRAAPCRWDLADLAAGLASPYFIPYLGRKSCPLGLPMAPLVIEAASVAAAFRQRDATASAPERLALGRRDGLADGGTVWADRPGPGEPELGLVEERIETRRDEPLSRTRWQFGLRQEVAAAWLPAAP